MIIKPKLKGGLGMVDFGILSKSLKLMALNRLFKSKDAKWTYIP